VSGLPGMLSADFFEEFVKPGQALMLPGG